MVSRLRRILDIKKVGHAGTLDPFATGLLIVCAGRPATRLISRFMDGEKEYLATLRLGVETETLDTEGAVTARRPVGEISQPCKWKHVCRNSGADRCRYLLLIPH